MKMFTEICAKRWGYIGQSNKKKSDWESERKKKRKRKKNTLTMKINEVSANSQPNSLLVEISEMSSVAQAEK